MINVDENKLMKIKKDALENFVPILRDETMKLIEKKLSEVKPSKILEVGTAVGYSASMFAKYLVEDENGKCFIDTIERNDARFETATENIHELGLEKVINIIHGDATEIMKEMKNDNTYDVVFIDAAKGQYMVFFNEAKRLVKPGGLIIADNVLWQGRVLGNYNEHRHRTAVTRLREYLKTIEEDTNLDSEVIDIEDGLAISKVNK